MKFNFNFDCIVAADAIVYFRSVRGRGEFIKFIIGQEWRREDGEKNYYLYDFCTFISIRSSSRMLIE